MPALGAPGGRAGPPSSTGPGDATETDRALRAVVFILDEDAAVRDAVAAALGAAGVEVRAFASAEAFLEVELPARPACLVVDIDLPTTGGPALIDLLAARGTRLPTIITSRRLRRLARSDLLLLEKPFGEDELIPVIRRVLALRAVEDPASGT
ncbi:MAG TPA: response regulator [Geminicoccaceae bacterium]